MSQGRHNGELGQRLKRYADSDDSCTSRHFLPRSRRRGPDRRKSVIDPSRRKNAVGIGSLLLVAGVVLQFVLKSTPSSPAHGPEAPDAKHTTADDTKSVARPQVPTAASHSGEMST